jgi:hypothetical protein
MKRLVIALVALLVAVGVIAGVALAQLTDTQTASGTINATSTSPDLYICEPGSTAGPACGADDSGADEIVFESQENMVPGETKQWDIRLKNVGTAPWLITNWSRGQVDLSGNGCGASLSQYTPTILGKAGDEANDNVYNQGLTFRGETSFSDWTVKVAPGDYEDLRLRVWFPPSVPGQCAGNQWSVSWTFEVTTTTE